MTSRVPIKIGAELYGHSSSNCDVEMICLMYESLNMLEINDIHIVLGHVGIFRKLVQEANLEKAQEQDLFESVQRKAFDEVDDKIRRFVFTSSYFFQFGVKGFFHGIITLDLFLKQVCLCLAKTVGPRISSKLNLQKLIGTSCLTA